MKRGLLVLSSALAVGWSYRVWRVVHPWFPSQTVETSRYTADYPSHWDSVDAKDPRLGEEEITFINHRAPAPELDPWDRPRWRMTLRDEGRAFPTAEALADSLRKQEERPEPLEKVHLSNGVEALTWVERAASVDIPFSIRWYVFQAPDCRLFRAGHDVPLEWKTRLRYERLFRSILSSVRFKSPGRR